MSVRVILGRSGHGKTTKMLEEVVQSSMENPGRNYYVIAPEQFGMEMQQKIIEMHPKHGFFNIDVLSFHRLAYRVFDECHHVPKDILEDLGVSMILRKIMSTHKEELLFFKKSMKKPGFIDEMKSMLMEFICYDISPDQLENLGEELHGHPGLLQKCMELAKIFELFENDISDRFMVSEQILSVLCDFVSKSAMLRDGEFYFDGFTGFTPVQLDFLRELMKASGKITITLTMDEYPSKRAEELFHFSRKTIESLLRICKEEGVHFETPTVIDTVHAVRYGGEEELSFLEENLYRMIPLHYQKDHVPAHIHMVNCKNPEEESEYILHRIEQLVRQKKIRYKDIAVLCGNVDDYASAFARSAKPLQIPVFEDVKKKVSYHSGIEAIRSVFHLVLMDYSYESVFRYLKSGMSDLGEEETDALENYILSAGIRGYSMWKKPFTRRMTGKEEAVIKKIQEYRERFMNETGELTLIFKDKEKNVKEKMEALYSMMCRLNYYEKFQKLSKEADEAGDFVRANEYRQLFHLLLELMDKIVGVFGEEYMPLLELSDVVDTGLESLGLGVTPLSMDQVILGDLKRTRLHDIKILFIAGLNEGKIPPNAEERGILSDDEKSILEACGISLSLNKTERTLEDEFYTYLAFTKPEDEIYFSYCNVDRDGSALRPSPLKKSLEHLFPSLHIKKYKENLPRMYFNEEDSLELLLEGMGHMDEEEWLKEHKAFRMLFQYWYEKPKLRLSLQKMWEEKHKTYQKESLDPALAREFFGEEFLGSVTRLERFAACPYQYYCIYGLNLFERDEYKIRPMDLGNVFHHALEFFSRKLKESEYSWKNLPKDEEEKLVEEALRASFDDGIKDIFEGNARNRYKVRTVRRILERTINVLKLHLKNSAFEPDSFELHFGKTNHLSCTTIPMQHGGRMHLEGTIDRVDLCETEEEVFVKVIDYKSGMKSFEMNDFYNGLQLQLIVYMNAALEMYGKEYDKTIVPAGVYYYHIKDPITKVEDDLARKKEFRMSGYTNRDQQVLDMVEQGESDYISVPVKLTKAGKPYKSSAILSTDDFFAVGDYGKKKVEEIGDRIYSGEIAAHPYKNEKGSACDYCPYASVCGFDERIEGFSYQKFEKKSPEEILEEIRKG